MKTNFLIFLGIFALSLSSCSKSLGTVENETRKSVNELIERENEKTGLIYKNHYELVKYAILHQDDKHIYSGQIHVINIRTDLTSRKHVVDTLQQSFPVHVQYADDNHAYSVSIDFSGLSKLKDMYKQFYNY